MPPRLSLRPLATACKSCASQSKAFFSSSGLKAVSRYTNASASRDLLDVDKKPQSSLKQTTNKSLGNDALDRVISQTETLRNMGNRNSTAQDMDSMDKRQALAEFQPRRWRMGDVYAPHDMSPMEQFKWSVARRPEKDMIDVLGINPLDHYKNFTMMSEYMTEMGRIKHSKLTGLRPVNQRKIAKAIRRAVGMGIHPSTHRHPLVLYTQSDLRDFADKKAIAMALRKESE